MYFIMKGISVAPTVTGYRQEICDRSHKVSPHNGHRDLKIISGVSLGYWRLPGRVRIPINVLKTGASSTP